MITAALDEKVLTIVEELSCINKINTDMVLSDDLGIDSLKIVELLVKLEDEFHIELDESDLDPSSLICVSDIFNLLNKYVAGNVAS